MGVATLTHGGKVLRFRTNPNSIRWTYTLNTKVEETYGGRVVQILSASIDDLIVTADSGEGSWTYMHQVGIFMRDMMFDQRNGGAPGTFSYPNRNWEMNVYAVNFPFKDNWQEVRREFTMQFKVQEDVSGVITTDSVRSELAALQKGVGYKHNEYNTPAVNLVDGKYDAYPGDAVDPNDPAAVAAKAKTDKENSAGVPTSNGGKTTGGTTR